MIDDQQDDFAPDKPDIGNIIRKLKAQTPIYDWERTALMDHLDKARVPRPITRRENDPTEGVVTFYVDGHDGPEFVRSYETITSVRVERQYSHDKVTVWNRGGCSGTLTVKAGDGESLAERLLR